MGKLDICLTVCYIVGCIAKRIFAAKPLHARFNPRTAAPAISPFQPCTTIAASAFFAQKRPRKSFVFTLVRAVSETSLSL
jgi:hypothetical protein